MKFRHEHMRNCRGEPWRHVWSVAGRNWCFGFALLVERKPETPLRLWKAIHVQTSGAHILWLWRFGFGIRLRALETT